MDAVDSRRALLRPAGIEVPCRSLVIAVDTTLPQCLDECLFALLVEDVQVLGVEDCFDRLARSRMCGRIHARDELVSVRRQIREYL